MPTLRASLSTKADPSPRRPWLAGMENWNFATVRAHLRAVFQKLRVDDKVALPRLT